MIIIGQKHCAATNPEIWKTFSDWFFVEYHKNPTGFWSENEVLSWTHSYGEYENV